MISLEVLTWFTLAQWISPRNFYHRSYALFSLDNAWMAGQNDRINSATAGVGGH